MGAGSNLKWRNAINTVILSAILYINLSGRSFDIHHNSFESPPTTTFQREGKSDVRAKRPTNSLLPERVITVVGPESSGTTFLTTALSVAAGIAPATTKPIGGRATSSDGRLDIQHVSLPWGWFCAEGDLQVVEALVPERCFRYERDPSLEAGRAGGVFWREHERKHGKKVREPEYVPNPREEERLRTTCREEAMISEDDDGWTCGGKCGSGAYDGFALYPQRYFLNITSHIEWHLLRGVDITVVLSLRDRTISTRGKTKGHCKIANVGKREDELALSLMAEAIEKYGRHGSRRRSLEGDAVGGNERVVPVSYEGLMETKEAYLFSIYKELGINSTYVPSFRDGNVKYVTTDERRVGTMQMASAIAGRKGPMIGMARGRDQRAPNEAG